GNECYQPGGQADDDDVEQNDGKDPPAFEDGQHLHPVDHGGEQQGDDRGEDEQQKDIEQVDDQVLALVKEHHQGERDQQVNQEPDRTLEVAPHPGYDPFVFCHGAS